MITITTDLKDVYENNGCLSIVYQLISYFLGEWTDSVDHISTASEQRSSKRESS